MCNTGSVFPRRDSRFLVLSPPPLSRHTHTFSLLHLLVIISDQWILCNSAPENEWNKVLLDGLTVGKGDVSPDDLYAVINKRIERVLIRTVRSTNIWILQGAGPFLEHLLTLTYVLPFSHAVLQEGGSYQQRILVEYLKEIQARAEEVVKVLQGPTI